MLRIGPLPSLPLVGSRVEIERQGDLSFALENEPLRPRLDHHLRMFFRIGQFGEGAFHVRKPDISRDQRSRALPAGHEVLWRAIEAGALRGGIDQSGVPV